MSPGAEMLLFWLLNLGVRIFGGVYCSNRAGKLNRNTTSWWILGFLFPIVSLIIIHFVKKKMVWEEETAKAPKSELV